MAGSLLIIGIINVVNARKHLKYADQIIDKPINIVRDFRPVKSIVYALIYNMLFGAVIGIVGAIYQLAVRNFVLANKAQFAHIEQLLKSSTGQYSDSDFDE